MKLKKDSVLAKAITGVVAIASGAMMLGLTFVPVNAQTNDDLAAQIQSLLAQIATLQAQLNAGGGTSPAGLYCNFSFTRDLAVGATGNDVMDLQKFLNSVPGVQVAASGVGSAGMETSYFGTLTAQAVSAFQVKYSSEILAPLGLTSGTGYFGASSRAKARDLCTSAPTPGAEICGDGIDNDGDGLVDEGCEDDEDPADDDLQGGEGSITDFDELSKYNNEEVTQGETEKVFGFTFEADASDISVRRVDILFEADGSTDANAEPWDFIEQVNLYHGDEEVASMDADSESDWSKVTDANQDGDSDDDTYRIRFSGLSEIVREDDSSEWAVEVVARDVIDSGDIDQVFGVSTGVDGIRAVDGAGINIYGGDTSRVTFTFTGSTAGTLELSDSEDFDDHVVAKVSATSDTDDVTVGMFELEADEQDVTVEDLKAQIYVSGGTDVDNIVTSLGLYVGDDLIETKTVTTSSASTSVEVTFDDIDYEIEEDETVTFTLKADVQELDGTTDQAEGVVIYAVVYGAGIVAEDAEGDDVTVSENWNTAGDYTVSLYSKLPVLSLTSTEAVKGSDDGSGNTTSATYTFKFTVQAVGGDIFIPNDAIGTTTSEGGSTDGVEIQIVTTGTASSSGVSDASATLQSEVTAASGFYKVSSGTTKSFTATVHYDNDNSSDQFAHAKVIGVNWATSTSNTTYATQQHFTAGFSDWKTSDVFLND